MYIVFMVTNNNNIGLQYVFLLGEDLEQTTPQTKKSGLERQKFKNIEYVC